MEKGMEEAMSEEKEDKKDKKKKKKPALKKVIGIALIVVQLVVMVLAAINVAGLQVLPVWLLVLLVVLLVLFSAFNLLTQLGRYHIIGKVMTVIWIALLGVVMWVASGYNSAFKAVAGMEDADAQFSVLVKIEDDASEVVDTKTYAYGITKGLDSELNELSIAEVMKDDNNIRPIVQQYDSLTSLYDALVDGEVGAIIFNERYRNMMEEIYPSFTGRTKVLATYEPQEVADLLGTSDKEKKTAKNVKKEAFTVFVSANSRTDEAANGGKSTLNALVTVNPSTHQALVIGIPANALIEATLGGQTGKDTMSHYSQMTIDGVKSVVGGYFGVDVDYYVSVHMDDELSGLLGDGTSDRELVLVTELLNSVSLKEYVLDGERVDSLAGKLRIDMDKKTVAKFASLFVLGRSKWNVSSYSLSGNVADYSCSFFNSSPTGCMDVDGEKGKAQEYVRTILDGGVIG